MFQLLKKIKLGQFYLLFHFMTYEILKKEPAYSTSVSKSLYIYFFGLLIHAAGVLPRQKSNKKKSITKGDPPVWSMFCPQSACVHTPRGLHVNTLIIQNWNEAASNISPQIGCVVRFHCGSAAKFSRLRLQHVGE